MRPNHAHSAKHIPAYSIVRSLKAAEPLRYDLADKFTAPRRIEVDTLAVKLVTVSAKVRNTDMPKVP